MDLQNNVLANMVRERFRTDSRLSNQSIDVEANERCIMLVGCVDAEELRQTAECVAKGVPGVRCMENQICVRTD